MPGIIVSGWTTYGIDLITGPSQAAKVAAAVLKPTNLRKSLLEVFELDKPSLSPRNSSVGIGSRNWIFLGRIQA